MKIIIARIIVWGTIITLGSLFLYAGYMEGGVGHVIGFLWFFGLIWAVATIISVNPYN